MSNAFLKKKGQTINKKSGDEKTTGTTGMKPKGNLMWKTSSHMMFHWNLFVVKYFLLSFRLTNIFSLVGISIGWTSKGKRHSSRPRGLWFCIPLSAKKIIIRLGLVRFCSILIISLCCCLFLFILRVHLQCFNFFPQLRVSTWEDGSYLTCQNCITTMVLPTYLLNLD